MLTMYNAHYSKSNIDFQRIAMFNECVDSKCEKSIVNSNRKKTDQLIEANKNKYRKTIKVTDFIVPCDNREDIRDVKQIEKHQAPAREIKRLKKKTKGDYRTSGN